MVFILLVDDSHFCHVFLGYKSTPSSQTSLSFWEDSFTRVHESCNKYFTKFIMIVTLWTEWVTRGFGLNLRRRRLCAARRITSQRTRTSSVGKTSSFSFCQVDMYGSRYIFFWELPPPAYLLLHGCAVGTKQHISDVDPMMVV